jgi:hypothetical protein
MTLRELLSPHSVDTVQKLHFLADPSELKDLLDREILSTTIRNSNNGASSPYTSICFNLAPGEQTHRYSSEADIGMRIDEIGQRVREFIRQGNVSGAAQWSRELVQIAGQLDSFPHMLPSIPRSFANRLAVELAAELRCGSQEPICRVIERVLDVVADEGF